MEHTHTMPSSVVAAVLILLVAGLDAAIADDLPIVHGVEFQPLSAQVERVAQAMELAGTPLTKEQRSAIDEAVSDPDPKAAVRKIQEVLDPLCLVGVEINPESRVKVQAGAAPKELMEQGWRTFLVKVHNLAGVTAPLGA